MTQASEWLELEVGIEGGGGQTLKADQIDATVRHQEFFSHLDEYHATYDQARAIYRDGDNVFQFEADPETRLLDERRWKAGMIVDC